MKILLTVEFYSPDKGGAPRMVENIARGLVGVGHDVTVATTFSRAREDNEIGGVKIQQFKLHGNSVSGIRGRASEIKRYKTLLKEGDFDVIFNYAMQSWPTDLAFSVLQEIKSVKVLAPVGHSRLRSPKYKDYYRELPKHLAFYDKIVYHSPVYQDKIYGDEKGFGDKAVIIGNGARFSEFGDMQKYAGIRDSLGIKTKYLAVVVSHHNFAKGHRFVLKAFRRMERDDTTLLIVGDRFVSYGLRRVAHFFLDYLYCFLLSFSRRNIMLASSPNRGFVLSVYGGADLQLNGSILECSPLVMYESFASKTPFVTTNVGNVMEHKEFLRVVNTPDEMADAANYLLDNDSERLKIAEEAFGLWKKNHTIEKIMGLYDELFQNLYATKQK